MNCPQTTITIECLALNVWKKIRISFSAEVGTPQSKYGMWGPKDSRSGKYLDPRFLPIHLTTKMELYSLETIEIRIFCNCGTSNQENSLKPLMLSNHPTAILTVLLLAMLTSQIKNLWGVFYQDPTKSKCLGTNKWCLRSSYRLHLWRWTFTGTTKKTLWWWEEFKVRFTSSNSNEIDFIFYLNKDYT